MRPYRDSRIVRITLFVFFALLLMYAAYEARGMLYGPVIVVPEQTFTVHDAHTLITGRAERIVELRLNGKTISVTESGEFQEPYLLAEGSNHLILEARDARGRTTRKTLDIMLIPQEGVIPLAPVPSTP
jgi:hypothetical protein